MTTARHLFTIGDDAWYAAVRRHVLRLRVFVPGRLLASGVRQGARGAYSNVACLNPRLFLREMEVFGQPPSTVYRNAPRQEGEARLHPAPD